MITYRTCVMSLARILLLRGSVVNFPFQLPGERKNESGKRERKNESDIPLFSATLTDLSLWQLRNHDDRLCRTATTRPRGRRPSRVFAGVSPKRSLLARVSLLPLFLLFSSCHRGPNRHGFRGWPRAGSRFDPHDASSDIPRIFPPMLSVGRTQNLCLEFSCRVGQIFSPILMIYAKCCYPAYQPIRSRDPSSETPSLRRTLCSSIVFSNEQFFVAINTKIP